MTPVAKILLLLFLLHNLASRYVAGAQDDPELVFKPKGDLIELGFCFAVDYIVIYRASPDGWQLLENSSAEPTSLLLPADLEGRVFTRNGQQLLGLVITNLTRSDSRVYTRECWRNQTLDNQHSMQLTVCDTEEAAEEIAVMEDGGVALSCNSSYVGSDGVTVRWYRDVQPTYKTTLFLDSGVSLQPLAKELQGVVGVRRGGAMLHMPNHVLHEGHYFHCIVMKSETCLSFQNIYVPDTDDIRVLYASPGDKVTLECPSIKSQNWETPVGNINTTTTHITVSDGSVMHIVHNSEAKTYSLLIPAMSEIYSGEYSCFGPSLLAYYSLHLCPVSEHRQERVHEGADVTLKCDRSQKHPTRAQWHHGDVSGQNSLIADYIFSNVMDLSTRMTLSEDGYTLKLTGLTKNDTGVYWCVVIQDLDFLNTDYIYEGEDIEGLADEDVYGDAMEEVYRCLSKQVTFVMVSEGRTTDPSSPSYTTAYALGALLVGLLVAAVIAAVIVKKKKKKKTGKCRENTVFSKILAVDNGC